MPDVVFKVCIFGDGGVGKTTLVKRYLTGLFDTDTKMTLGVDFYMKHLKIEEKHLGLQIWDFSGEEQFRFLLPGYVRGASGGIFMYDITRYSSLKHLEEWLEVFRESFNELRGKIPLIMVGGKLDLDHKRSVDQEDAIERAKKFEMIECIECSAKTGQNVEQIFITLSQNMLEKADLF